MTGLTPESWVRRYLASVDTAPATVLYIDDQLANRILVREAMKRLGDTTVMAVENGEDGIHAAKVYQPSAILLDLNLGGGETGESVLARLKDDPDTSHIPVYILSADDRPDRWSRMVSLGATGRIIKDPLLARLVENITSVLALPH